MPSGPLSPDGVDFSNATQAQDFLSQILDDDELKIIGNAYARYFWYGIVVTIGVAAIFHWTYWLTLKLRLRAAAQKKSHPAKPKGFISNAIATQTAMMREATYVQLTPAWRTRWLQVPPVGTVMLVLAHFAFVLALEFVNNNVEGAQFWQARGVRAGWLAVAQVPLLVLLVGRNNLISMFTGVSYERLNVLHRWTARIMLFLTILHFGYQNYGWTQYGLRSLEWSTDTCPPTGIAAFALLLWMNLSTVAPFRHWSYEFFVVQHIITFFGFIIAVMFHLPTTALWSRIYIFIPIALYLIDRIVRTVLFTWLNARRSRATLTALEGGVTKVRLHNAAIKSWAPGAFVQLSIPKFGWVQTHPATIASTPNSHGGDLIFMLKSHKGFTKRIMTSANNSTTALLPHTKEETAAGQNAQVETFWATLNGPYGGQHADFAAFDSVCLIAGSTGVTFTLALLQDLAHRAVSPHQLPLRRVHFVWCVKDSSWTSWCATELAAAHAKLEGAGIDCVVSIYVTCADEFTNQGDEQKECGCTCDKSLGPCCCTRVDEDVESQEDATTSAVGGGKLVTANEKAVSASSASSTSEKEKTASATRLPILPCAAFYSGRPDVREVLTKLLNGAQGESAIASCGPLGLSATVRNMVVRLSDERAIHKGTGAQGCYLHVESFS